MRFAAFLLVPGLAAGAQPSIQLKVPSVDLGTITPGQPRDFIFTLENKGGFPVKITKIEPSCGCTTSTNESKGLMISPGGSVDLPFRYDTRGIYGAFHKDVKIHTSDPENPVVTGVFVGVGVEPISISQNIMTLAAGVRGAVAEGVLDVRFNTPARIPPGAKVETEGDWLTAEWVSRATETGVGRLRVQADTSRVPKDETRGRGLLRLITGITSVPVVEVQVFWTLPNPFRQVPLTPVAGVAPGTEGVATFTLQAETPFQVVEATSGSPDFKIEWSYPQKGLAAFRITATKPLAAGKRHESFRVKTDLKDAPVVSGRFFFVTK